MPWLYKPKENATYKLPIHSEENVFAGATWQFLIDTYVANNGHKVNPQQFREHILEHMQMVTDDIMDTLPLVIDRIMEEIRKP